jgi:polyhydroxyalkanoate synthase
VEDARLPNQRWSNGCRACWVNWPASSTGCAIATCAGVDANAAADSAFRPGSGAAHHAGPRLNEPSSLAKRYAQFARLVLEAARQELDLEPEPGDRRFKDPLWRTSPLHRTLLQVYLAWQKSLGAWVGEQRLTPDDEQRVRFVLDQLVAALAPSNLPLNPAALKRADTTEGASAVQGLKQWVDDALHHGAMPTQIRPDAFRVGEDLATTPGAVVYRYPLFELLQYDSLTPTVHSRPLLMVPPQINKYYIFDLQPGNSVFRYLLEQGFQLFCLSWRNPDAALRDAGLEQYVQATLQAVEVVRSITRSASVGLISACAGGLTAMAAMGRLAMERSRAVAHHSLLVTARRSRASSVLKAFAGRETLLASAVVDQRGVMEGPSWRACSPGCARTIWSGTTGSTTT